MKSLKAGSRQPLLFYRRAMDRVWQYTLFLGIFMGAAGWWSLPRSTTILGLHSDIWLLACAILSFAVSIFAFFSRFFAYVQANVNYLQVATPFLRLRISYQRIRSIHPVLVQQVHPPEKAGWGMRTFITPFYGKTALVVELNSFPLNPFLLRLFIPKAMFATETTGLVLLVPDWMKLSTELDSLRGAQQQLQNRRTNPTRAW